MGSVTDIAAGVFTMGLSTMVQQMAKSPSIPSPAAPAAVPQSQASKTPDAASVANGQMNQGQAGGSPGVAQTMLTGPGGVDPSTLNLGKSTLLGA